MRILLFVAGVGLLLPYWLGDLNFLVAPALLVGLLVAYWKPLRWVVVFVVAVGYSSHQVHTQLQQQLSGCSQKLQVQALVQIQEVQPQGEQTTRLVGVLRELLPVRNAAKVNSCHATIGQRYRLTWRSAPELVVGSIWHADLVLSEPWGYANLGGFDYQRWLLGANLSGTGYVRRATLAIAAPGMTGIASLRSRLAAELGRYSQAGVLQALVLGDVSKLDNQAWQRLRTSGTVHLFIVSGLHVGLVATASFFLLNRVLRLCPWIIKRCPVQRVAALATLLISGAYVVLTGANVPGVRAWLMLSLALLWLARGRHTDFLLGYLWALIAVLLWMPRSGWQQGFYLSFGAVGVLIWFFRPRHVEPSSQAGGQPVAHTLALAKSNSDTAWLSRLAAGLLGRFKLLLKVQVALLLGMGPMTVAFGLATPSLGLLVNLVAVPWVSFVVVPLALLGTVSTLLSSTLGHLLLACANEALLVFQQLLSAVSTGTLWQPPRLAWWGHLVHGLIGLLCLAPLVWRVRAVALLAYASILLQWQPAIPLGEFRLLAMDVGQGDAILISTKNHHLLFDAGPAYASGFNAAQSVIEPTLGALAIRSLDGLVVSHSDMDHAGGALRMRQAWQPALDLQGGSASATQPSVGLGSGLGACEVGQGWVWDQVEFEFLSPSTAAQRLPGTTSNDASCVLRVTSSAATRSGQDRQEGRQAILFGDVSARTELSLLARLNPGLSIMTAPHHGSATSSSYALVRRLRPKWVIASAARHSRYGHPHPDVVTRYCGIGSQLFVTGEAGAVSWRSDAPNTIELARAQARPWRGARTPSQLARCG